MALGRMVPAITAVVGVRFPEAIEVRSDKHVESPVGKLRDRRLQGTVMVAATTQVDDVAVPPRASVVVRDARERGVAVAVDHALDRTTTRPAEVWMMSIRAPQ